MRVATRITANVSEPTAKDLGWLMNHNGWDQTEVVNKAIRALRYLQEHEGDNGVKLVHPDGEVTCLKFL